MHNSIINAQDEADKFKNDQSDNMINIVTDREKNSKYN